MKRSEMVMLMVDATLNPPDNIQGMNDGGAQLIRMQEYLLSVLEGAGMRPPVTGSISSQIAAIHNQWEPE